MDWSILFEATAVLIVTAALLSYYVFVNHRMYNGWTPRIYRSLKNIPYPEHKFIIGAALEFHTSQEGVFKLLRDLAKRFPRFYQLWMLNYASVHMIYPNDVEKLLSSTKNLTKGNTYQLMEPWLQDGLLTTTGAKWHHRRKLLTPSFHYSILRQFTTIFSEQSAKIVDDLRQHCTEPYVNIIDYMTEFALKTISETAMGYRQDENKTQSSDLTNYKQSIYGYGTCCIHRLFRPWLYNIMAFNLSPSGRISNKHVSVLQKFTRKVIKERMAGFDNSIVENIENDDETDVMSKKRLAMLDLLISQKLKGAEIDDEGIAEEVDTFMFEGHDTTTVAMSFALMLLANHRDVQDSVYKEVIDIMGEDRSKLPTSNDLQKMVVLERVLKESLRLYPPVWFIVRALDEDLQLDDCILPAHIEAFVHIYDVHRHPEFWPNPNVFDPDRFLPENSYKRHPFAFIPFSAGPRNCIGQKFALLEEKALVSTILRNFILEPVDTPDTIELIADIILRPKNGLKIKIVPRP